MIDNALTRPWTVTKNYRRAPQARPGWPESNCVENNQHVLIGNEHYMLSWDGLLMPAKKDRKNLPTRDISISDESNGKLDHDPTAWILRLHHRRRRLGRLRARQPPDRLGPPSRLLEAGGGDRNIWIHIPLGYGKLFSNAKVNWLYNSEPEPELNNRQIIQPRGKVLGGSSSINGLLYIRGQAEDFDHWRQLGNAGWSFADVLPYFRHAEDQERGASCTAPAGRSAVSNVCEPHPLCEAFIAAAQQAGFPRNDDFNGPTQEGAGYFQLTARNGRRWSTAVGYLRQARRRPNLAIISRTRWRPRILFSGTPRRRRRIPPGRYDAHRSCERRGDRRRWRVQLAAIAAAFGLGPAELLRAHGIDVVADMPGVGADLQDHLQVRMQYRCTEPITMNDVINSWRQRIGAGMRYALFRKGLLTIGAGYAGGFFRTSPDVATPDVQVHFLIFSAETAGAARCIRSRASSRRSASCGRRAAASCASSRPIRQRPRRSSRATSRTRSYRDTVVAGVSCCGDHGAAGDAALHRREGAEPGCTSDADLLAFARATGTTVFHPTSTCRMGADPAAIVDERLVLGESVEIAAPLTHFLRASVTRRDDGAFEARLAGSQSSAVLTAMARANALLVVPADSRSNPAGATLNALPLTDDLWMSERFGIQ